ncbi:hypothetical protein CHRYSEOSP005_04870 [Chryseobacterium sp. Alg-005]|uniref:DUF3108 domain-containing protein n=1 Tax=Chryseobacterium sp. Alg-005 TaxID=3159516 RepID=UPI00355571B2
MKTLLSVFFLLFMLPAMAQDVITPKNIKLESAFIKDETYDMLWFMENAGQRIEIGKINTIIKKDKGKILIRTSLKMKQMQEEMIDSAVAKINNMEPVEHSSFAGHRDIRMNFGKDVTGYYLDKKTNEKSIINEAVAPASYFDSNLYPSIIRWLPLKEDYKATLRIFDYNPAAKKGVMNAYIKNVKKESLNGKMVWVITTTDDITDNKTLVTYYIDTDQRKLLKQEVEIDRRKMVMELIK